MNDITYIVPVYGKPGLLTTCLSTFRKFHPADRILVVDDCGPDGEEMSRVCSIYGAGYARNAENLGFAGNCNFGIEQAQTDYVCLVNSDIEFTAPISARIEANFQNDDKMVIQGGRLWYPDGTIQHGGGYYKWNQMAHYGHGKEARQAKLTGISAYRLYVTGALMSIRRRWWLSNEFDETYFNDSEDGDLCMRAWEDGKHVFYDPAITAIHAEGKTRGANQEEKIKAGTWKRGEESRKKLMMRVAISDMEGFQDKQNELNLKLHPGAPVIFKRMGAIGDVLRAWNVFREWFPTKLEDVIVVTAVPEVFAGIEATVTSNVDEFEASEIYDLDLAYERHRDLSIEGAYRKVLGLPDDKTHPIVGMWSDSLDEMSLRRLAHIETPYVVIHMGVSWPSKTMPIEFWKTLCLKLVDKGITVVCVGSDGSFEPQGNLIVNLVGKTSLSMLRKLLEGAALFIGPDSGVLHMADGACPAIGLFTCALPEKLVSSEVTPIVTKAPCAGCLHRQPTATFYLCDYAPNDPRHLLCAVSFNPYEVLDKALELMKKKEVV